MATKEGAQIDTLPSQSYGWDGSKPVKMLSIPTKLPAKTDIKISVIASQTGVVITTLRGWLEAE